MRVCMHAYIFRPVSSPLRWFCVQVCVHIVVPSRGWRFPCRLRPTDFLQDVIDALVQGAAGVGETIVDLPGTCVWTATTPHSAGVASSAGASATTATAGVTLAPGLPIFHQFPGGVFPIGYDIVCDGVLRLQSEAKPVSFCGRFQNVRVWLLWCSSCETWTGWPCISAVSQASTSRDLTKSWTTTPAPSVPVTGSARRAWSTATVRTPLECTYELTSRPTHVVTAPKRNCVRCSRASE
jgi:hypothetical protein